MKYFVLNFLIVSYLFVAIDAANAARRIEERDYFASIRSNKANVRSGPGKHYPIKFTFGTKDVPVKVISEYDNWNEIKDYQGHTGWISKALLTKRRSLMVVVSSNRKVNFYNKKDDKSRVLFYLKNFVIGDYISCEDRWCKMRVQGKKGWVKRGNLFGD